MMSLSESGNGHVVYAVTGAGNDRFSAMTRISIFSLRRFNPKCRVTVAFDSISLRNLLSVGDPLLQETDAVLEVPTPEGGPEFRNRFVKTTLRSCVSGPFLFMDSDTLVRGDIGEIFLPNAEIKGCLNHSIDNILWQIQQKDRETLDLMNWNIWKSCYINGGIIYYSDSEKSRQFANQWHEYWLASYRKTGSCKDQPALNAALASIVPSFKLLSCKYNAQIKSNSSSAVDASVWHYYASNDSLPVTHVEELVETVLKTSRFPENEAERVCAMNHPWLRCESLIGAIVLKALNIRCYINPTLQKYLEGKYTAFALFFFRDLTATFAIKLMKRLRSVKRSLRSV
jgi:hypothetical protein